MKFGAGAVEDAGWELERRGVRRVMLVTDPGIAALGLPARVQRRGGGLARGRLQSTSGP